MEASTDSIYLDYNATTPLRPSVIEVVNNALVNLWGNPSSSYVSGSEAKNALEKARSQVGLIIGCTQPQAEITFTSGGTESNYLAMYSAIELGRARLGLDKNERVHVITTNIEHVATEKPLRDWQEKGLVDVSFVAVNKESGRVDVNSILGALRKDTVLVTIILANNETGVIQPVKQLGKELGNKGVLLHTDAAQALGKIDVDINDLDVDYLSIVGHKFYGPRIGALYHRPGHLKPLFLGGGQEMGRRAGTENLPMIVGLGAASEEVRAQGAQETRERLGLLRGRLYSGLKKNLGDRIEDNFDHIPENDRLPNTLSASFKHVEGKDLLAACKSRIQASTGAACHSSTSQCSQILLNSGLTREKAKSSVRLSVGMMSSMEQMDRAAAILAEAYFSIATK